MNKRVYWDFGGIPPQDPSAYRRDFWGALFCGLFAAALCAAGVDVLLLKATGQATTLNLVKFVYTYHGAGLPLEYMCRIGLDAIAALVAFGFAFAFVAQPRNGIRHISGRQLYTEKDALKKAQRDSAAEIKNNTAGVFLNKNLQISEDRETKHMLISGGTGSGKTVILSHLIAELFARKDKAIIVDWKGDFSKYFACQIFNPFDKRSVIWKIGRDCVIEEQASELAAIIIPASKSGDPFFSLAGQGVLTSLIIKLQLTKPRSWGWGDIYLEFAAGYENILNACTFYNAHAAEFISEKGKQTQGVLATISARLDVVRVLMKAEQDNPKAQTFSVYDWLQRPAGLSGLHQQIIVGGLPEFENLCRVYMRLFFVFAGKTVMGLNEGQRRRIWFICDEFPKLGKVEVIPQLIEFGRSKGARVVLACQDFAQIAEVYGNNIYKSLTSMCGTIIIGRTAGSDTAETIAKTLIGSRIVERRNITRQSGGGSSTSWQRDELPTVYPSDLQSGLGVNATGINALLLGLGDGVHRLHFEFSTRKQVRTAVKLRECFKGIKREIKKLVEQNEVLVQQVATAEKTEENGQKNEAAAGVGGDLLMGILAVTFPVVGAAHQLLEAAELKNEIAGGGGVAAPLHTTKKLAKAIETDNQNEESENEK